MKFLSALVILVAFTQCRSIKFENNVPFRINSAIYSMQSGLEEITTVISYTSNNIIEFESIYFRNRITNLVTKDLDADKIMVGYFLNNYKKDFIMDDNPTNELKNPFPNITEFPFDLKENEAVISYKEKGKTKFYRLNLLQKQ
jgi:hypothetical protein